MPSSLPAPRPGRPSLIPRGTHSDTASAPKTPPFTMTRKPRNKSPIASLDTTTTTYPSPRSKKQQLPKSPSAKFDSSTSFAPKPDFSSFYRQLAFQQHSFSDPAGNLFHKFDPVNHRPGDERHVANMLLGVAWRDAGPEIDRMSRYESRLRVRYEKAIKRLDTLIANRQREDEQEPLPPKPPSHEKEPLPNEPNSGLTSMAATPLSNSPAPVAPPAPPLSLGTAHSARPRSLNRSRSS